MAIPQVAITSQPQDLIVSTNDPATFNVVATGTAPIGYQWYFYGNSTNNTPVPGSQCHQCHLYHPQCATDRYGLVCRGGFQQL